MLQAQFLREKTALPSPFQWIYYIAYFVRQWKMEKSGGLVEERMHKRKEYLKLLKKLLEIKLHNDFEKTREDKLADLRRDINLDLDALKKDLIAKMAGK